MQALELAELVKGPGQGRSVSLRGATVTRKADSAETGGGWSLMEYSAPPHFEGPPPHWHAQLVEAFYVLEGTLAFTIGEQTIMAESGSFVLVPAGVAHAFSNPTAEPTRFLTFCTPGGFEGYFDDLAALAASSPPDQAALALLWERYDIRTGTPPIS